ncbi:MAG: dephospho-CoA kinase [Bryobacteraceae bacterium]
MLRVGLTGGLASGKSLVGQALQNLGCHLIQADELGHAMLAPGGAACEAVLREFGTGILDDRGAISRPKLAEEVFENPERLAVLNGLIHPHVIRREEELMEQAAALDPHGIAVVEAAILIETSSYKRFDRIVLAVCTREQQIERAMRRDCWTRQETEARLARQMPLDRKREFADHIIDTSGTKEATLRQVRELYEQLRSR